MKELKVIARIHTDMPEKFGIPRQSGIVKSLTGRIVFEPEYRSYDAVKGLEEFSHLWLLWEFEGVPQDKFNATVRPPRLGGNETMGVFATRSPFRPNPIGLSSVKLEGVEKGNDGPVIIVSGIDLRDNTPIFDIKPYLAYADSHPEAKDGFAGAHVYEQLNVDIPLEFKDLIGAEDFDTVVSLLKEDPRPHYQKDPERVYGMAFKDLNIKFKVLENILTVVGVEK
ncbi:MAG: tRNA (N6-threonylcarbamoyladenosine(37)-N6)-methyltransferase TrmO [Lachnospiraceae bacterium]|nr:tRNA (N6-threonylcarbamoyladenosine(37)-N6)-methyltransferase TrmO [Lachnospiraceae bacterium]